MLTRILSIHNQGRHWRWKPFIFVLVQSFRSSRMVWGLHPLSFWTGLKAERARVDPLIVDFRLRAGPWLQMLRTLVGKLVDSQCRV